MIIDLIIDRKDGATYNPKQFYSAVSNHAEIGFGIATALDSGTNENVVSELCKYITNNQYNGELCEYVKSMKWL